jgi:NAD-dependent SIR2 family protein deacetylase
VATSLEDSLKAAAEAIAQADGLIVAAGAGMGVDSGLPDFRGPQGFWRAYPPFAKLGLRFEQLADPRWFDRDPPLAWGFYGHRRNAYRAADPHVGYLRLLEWAQSRADGGFVFTSNVDGHFRRAGFADDRIVECHGSIEWMQCSRPCSDEIWPAEASAIEVDPATMRACPPLPACPLCGRLARPNVLMFDDAHWLSDRADAQWQRLEHWLWKRAGERLVIVECGAGGAIPTVRRTCEQAAEQWRARLIRINPTESTVPTGQISLPMTALAALEAITAKLKS